MDNELCKDILSRLTQLNRGVTILVWINVASIVWLCIDEYRKNVTRKCKRSKETKPTSEKDEPPR
jgi:hypothetical protein